jgi:hypothetical protein
MVWHGMAWHRETLGTPWIPLAIWACLDPHEIQHWSQKSHFSPLSAFVQDSVGYSLSIGSEICNYGPSSIGGGGEKKQGQSLYEKQSDSD